MPRREPLPSPLAEEPFHIRDGRALGLTRGRMRGDDLVQPYRGVRVPLGLPLTDLYVHCRAYGTRMRADQVFRHTTAARLWGTPLPERLQRDPVIHVSTIGAGTRPRLAGVAGHRLRSGTAACVRHGLRVTDAATTWLQLASLLGVDDLVAVADFLIMTPRRQHPDDPRPFVTVDELGTRILDHRGRGRRNALLAGELMRDGAESARETALRLALVRRGLPEPTLNGEILNSRGWRIGFGDLVYPEWKVLVEYDGEQHRTDRAQYHRDQQRHDALLAEGWAHIRENVSSDRTGPHSAPARAESALRQRGWVPSGQFRR